MKRRRADEYKRPDVALSAGEVAMLHRRIARSVKYGMTLKQAARHYGMDPRRIQGICAEFNVAPPTTAQRDAGAA